MEFKYFSQEFARKILEYKDNRKELVDKINNVYTDFNVNNPFIDCSENDIEPFYIISAINRYGKEKLTEWCIKVKDIFELNSEVPTEIKGIPYFPRVLGNYRTNTLKEENYIQKAWALFECAIKYADNQTEELKKQFIENIPFFFNIPYVSYNLTVFLYDMRPDFYVNLDEKNRGFLNSYEFENYRFLADNLNDKNTGEKYLAFCEEIRNACKSGNYEFNSISQLSYLAWKNSNKGKSKIMATTYAKKDDKSFIGLFYNQELDNILKNYKINNIINKKIDGLLVYKIQNSSLRGRNTLSISAAQDSISGKKIYHTLLFFDVLPPNNTPNIRFGFNLKIKDYNFGANQKIYYTTHQKNGKFHHLIIKLDDNDIITFIDNKRQNNDYLFIIKYKENNNNVFEIIEDSSFYNNTVKKEIDDIIKKINDTKSKRKENNGESGIKTNDDEPEQENSENNGQSSDNKSNLIKCDEINFKPENIIFYGVPGCGKSYFIKNTYIQKYAVLESKGQIVRTVFHPDYTYSDFVGQILPKTNNSGQVTYEFKPGPFTKILKSAYENPKCAYYLIIEEINRGNAPAIFGDLFQLLDRIDTGESEYFIENEDIAQKILKPEKENKDNNKHNEKLNEREDKEKIKEELGNNQIKIPRNLKLVATMNTSDQNVFTLDTAFQRRWKMRLIRNEFGNDGIEKLYIPGTATTWGDFWKAINDKIVENNNGLSSEDKRLGTHFVKESDLSDSANDSNKEMAERFAEKVYRYLWDDAFKMDKHYIFNDFKTLEDVLNEVSEKMSGSSQSYKLSDIFKTGNINFAEEKSSSVSPSGAGNSGNTVNSEDTDTNTDDSLFNEDEINQQKENEEIGDTSDTPEKQLPEENGNSEE